MAMPARSGWEIWKRWSDAINKIDNSARSTSLDVADKPCRKIGGELRSRVSRAMEVLRRIQV
jgi:hypothetical protein